ncbi:OLC1v1010545C1 [Oldenlandia corymbosa var. corymbosa]|uniref:Large ribosomal subunit protein bL9c n=1 Tax=Oldenlandia corymbosa var. corymbosa TaxID=529605 RepID=A0AAV1DUA1_OLDCO|nr:OLC1v1010545C1 [Oldenlandia corymbosa var. corymbosa]
MAYYAKNVLRVGSGAGLPNPLFFAAQGVRYRKVEVILTSNIHKLGKPGDTVKVRAGFFRNHLMPKLLAVPNIDKFADLVREQRKLYEPKEVEEIQVVVPKTREDRMREYQMAARRLDSALLVLRKFTLAEDEVREPVTKDEIVAEVARQLSVRIEPENLYLPTPLSTFGEFEVPLRLPRSIPLPDGKLQWGLKIKIRRK